MNLCVNGITLHYEIFGEGRPILLLGGNMRNTSYMNFMRKELASKYKVYVIDRRGSGKSTKNCELSYSETVKDISAFIKTLKIDKPFILGHSGGGRVALLLAMRLSSNLSGLVICSGLARTSIIRKPGYASFLEKIPWYPGKASNEKFEKMMTESSDLTNKVLANIKCPVLVVSGDKDPIVPVDEAKFIAGSIADSKMLILPGENHASYMSKRRWVKHLKRFLELH